MIHPAMLGTPVPRVLPVGRDGEAGSIIPRGDTPDGQRKVGRGLVTLEPSTGAERLIKPVDRVRDLAEVFTPSATVQAILDLLPAAIWAVHPSPSFLEPACGDGNFPVPIPHPKL